MLKIARLMLYHSQRTQTESPYQALADMVT